MVGRTHRAATNGSGEGAGSASDGTPADDVEAKEPSHAQLRRATRARRIWSLVAALCLLVAVVFLILVEVGNVRRRPILNRIYFIKIDLTDIVPLSVPDAVLINSIAQTLGLHDFYTVGLWNFCEGYNGQGTTNCSKPHTLYWFNPVRIIESELLAGATIALPEELNNILTLLRRASQWMFGLFLAGICLDFVMIFIVPWSLFSRWTTLPIMLLTFLAALCTTIATVLGTAIFVIMKKAITSATQLNIRASIGVEMFAYMWVATAAAIIAWIITLCLTCCCASRRDVRRGKKRGSKKAWKTPALKEKNSRR